MKIVMRMRRKAQCYDNTTDHNDVWNARLNN